MTVENRIKAGGADHCLWDLHELEARRDPPREPVLAAVAERLKQIETD